MCGIAGIWHLDGTAVTEQKLKTFTDSMANRGPDGSGYAFLENNTLGLGHRRLSILDLSDLGKQPMASEDGRYTITYNGEVFNFGEIKAELEILGYKFKSNTDTEVILAAWDKWGIQTLDKFNGMWAIAIWDELRKELTLCRDRFGIKPLYYLHIPGKILSFASETRAFKYLEGFQRSLDKTYLDLQVAGIPIVGSGHSIFQNIKQILPGHYAVVSANKPLQQKRWWHISNHLHNSIPKSFREQTEYFYELFKDACRIRLISDVPIGTALSGGLDSSSVYSMVHHLLNTETFERSHKNNQQAFVATFPGLAMDERKYAEEAVAFTGGPVTYLEQNDNNLPDRVAADTMMFDAISTAPITSIAGIYEGMKKNGISVSLDGHAVDEMMYGYRDMLYRLYHHYFSEGSTKLALSLSDIIVETYAESERERVYSNLNVLREIAKNPIKRLKYKLGSYLKNRPKDNLENHPMLLGLGEDYQLGQLPYPQRLLYFETFVNSLPTILGNFDRAGMMHGVEIRMPFMDWRLVTYLFSLPTEAKIGGGYNKRILREAMKGKMAEGLRQRTFKVGIGSPIEHWANGPLKEWMMDLLSLTKLKEDLFVLSSSELLEIKKINSGEKFDLRKCQRIWQEINAQLLK
jgi:asparagine synthase (glutamine-hydrolysing)